jgi:DNA mismatch endonuclease (patch repair protein)
LADVVSPEVRSRMMAGIGPVNTKPEMIIRRGLHARGWRYRLHARGLAGKPDLVFPGRRAVIFVQGCFWHGHDCVLFRWPSTRPEFWRAKIGGNIARDARVRATLAADGWRICDVWECTMKGRTRWPVEDVLAQCDAFLAGTAPFVSLGGAQTVTVEDSA